MSNETEPPAPSSTLLPVLAVDIRGPARAGKKTLAILFAKAIDAAGGRVIYPEGEMAPSMGIRPLTDLAGRTVTICQDLGPVAHMTSSAIASILTREEDAVRAAKAERELAENYFNRLEETEIAKAEVEACLRRVMGLLGVEGLDDEGVAMEGRAIAAREEELTRLQSTIFEACGRAGIPLEFDLPCLTALKTLADRACQTGFEVKTEVPKLPLILGLLPDAPAHAIEDRAREVVGALDQAHAWLHDAHEALAEARDDTVTTLERLEAVEGDQGRLRSRVIGASLPEWVRQAEKAQNTVNPSPGPFTVTEGIKPLQTSDPCSTCADDEHSPRQVYAVTCGDDRAAGKPPRLQVLCADCIQLVKRG